MRRRRPALLLLSLLLAPPARAQEEGIDADDAKPERGGAAAPEPSPAESMQIIVGYELAGSYFDAKEKLEALLASVAPLGSPFVASGPADEVGGVLIGTLPREKKALEAVGYGRRR